MYMYLVEFAVSSSLIAFCSSMWKLEEGFQALNFPVPECSLLSIQWPAYVDKKEGNVKWRQKVKVEICRDGLNKSQNLIRIGLNRLPDSEIRFLNPVPEIRSPKSGPRNPVPEPAFEVRPWLAQGQSETLRGDDLVREL